MRAKRWFGAVLGLGALHVAVGLAGVLRSLATGEAPSATLPLWVFPVQMLVFSGAASALVAGGRGDLRTLSLACAFALIATSFARRPALLVEAWLSEPFLLALLRGLRVDAFLPVFVWIFFREFPRAIVVPRARLVAQIGIGIAAVSGVVLFAANVLLVVAGRSLPALSGLDPEDPRSPYWGLVYGLTLLALPFALWKARRAPAEERRRAALFATGIIAAALPYCLFVLALVLSPTFTAWFRGPGRAIVIPFVELLILSIPITTAYAVLVDRVLPVRVLLRSALQFGLARGVVTAGAALPFAWIVWYVYPLRGEPLSELFSGSRGLTLAGAGVLGLVAIRARERARDAIDRTFFREEYDARRTLLAVADQSRRVKRTADLAELLASEIDRALHLERVSILFVDPLCGDLYAASGDCRPLGRGSALAALLAQAPEPVEVDLERAASPLRELPAEEQHWLADGAVRLLVPLLSSGGELIGLMALGARRSERPFGSEDRQLLAAIGAAGAVTLESRIRSSTPAAPSAEAEPEAGAWSCAVCQLIHAVRTAACPDCGGALEPTALPHVLRGKFQLERRIGEGGMGVVYLARDLDLGRPVAIKTLPRTSPEDAIRLRREARAMAAVLHPNLAVLYAAESWMGTPLLVTEFLEGGTLAERILPGRLRLHEAGTLGSLLADALERVHRAGILHRDLKPSNIGYSADGVPKLLDFGLARMVGEAGAAAPFDGEPVGPAGRRTTRSQHGVVGTPLYMSPEAIRGEAPDVTFDLWSLAVVLYEAVAGQSPVERATWAETLAAIQRGPIADVREHASEAPPELAAFFADAFHAERRRRPASAAEFRRRWQEARRGLDSGADAPPTSTSGSSANRPRA